MPQTYFFVQKPVHAFEKRFEAKYRRIKRHAWYIYNLVLLENNKEVNKMKELIEKFEERVQDRLDEFDRTLEEKVEVRLE